MKPEPIKFLLVDDTPENLVALQGLLRRDGLETLTARSGPEALELLLVHDVALALLDVQMPEMNGFQLAELMRGAERTKHIPIIFVTAGARDPSYVFKGYESGAVDFLFKPIEPHALRSKADVFFELHKQKRELAGALRLNEMFVGILGHDLRNPLSAMLTGAQLLERGAADQAQQKTLRRMISAGHRMTEMIDQLLDLPRARLGSGFGFAHEREVVDVGGLVRRSVDELKVAKPDAAIELEESGPSETVGDPGRLLQLFSNVIANAVTHRAAGSPVRVSVVSGEADVAVAIWNQGTISPALIPSLFEPFQGRTDASTRPAGLGLGLYISQQIARAHGGDIGVVSTDDGGTTFTIRIPRRAA